MAVDSGATAEELKQIAVKGGLKTLQDSCGELVLQGMTTMEELIKVTYSND